MTWVLIVWVSFSHSRSLVIHEFRTEKHCLAVAEWVKEKYSGFMTGVETECIRLPDA